MTSPDPDTIETKTVCPVTGTEPPPVRYPIVLTDTELKAGPHVARCWVCGLPLQIAHFDTDGRRIG